MNAETTDNLREEINYLEKECQRMEQLIDDIIEGRKVWVEDKGWIKNMYNEDPINALSADETIVTPLLTSVTWAPVVQVVLAVLIL